MIRWVLPLLASVAAFGQTAPARPEFEVASIKPSAPPSADRVNVGVHVDGAQVSITYLSLKEYIRIANQVKDYQVTGPEWITSARFDIAAKLPAGATREQIPEMLQALLADRFQVKLHHETKEFPVYAIVVGKGGSKLKESALDPVEPAPSGPGDGRPPVNVSATGGRDGVAFSLGRGASFSFANNRVEGKKLTMTGLADTLWRFVDRPVVDMTELTGTYDFTLDLTPEDYRAMLIRSALTAGVTLPPEALRLVDGSTLDSLFNSFQALGLKLEPRKAPLPVLVVDHAEKAPTEN
ncbi:MAG TPA: TIGR03435 family protein [Bryobacteraceae bacterium]|nr:TIGR03435 family protein [Bryobacteraceae bacterium]